MTEIMDTEARLMGPSALNEGHFANAPLGIIVRSTYSVDWEGEGGLHTPGARGRPPYIAMVPVLCYFVS